MKRLVAEGLVKKKPRRINEAVELPTNAHGYAVASMVAR